MEKMPVEDFSNWERESRIGLKIRALKSLKFAINLEKKIENYSEAGVSLINWSK